MVSSPSPPDPYKQASAQQAADLGASTGSSIINNPNINNPYGSQSYALAGYETIYDAQGKPQYVPRYTQNTTLSPDQQKLLGLQTQTQYNLGQTGVQQSAKLNNLLGTSLDTTGLQDWSAGQAPGQLATTYGGNNPVQMGIGSGGDVRQDQAPTDRKAVEDAMMSRYLDTANKQNTAQDVQMAARGLNPGSAQYSSVDETRQKALTDAQMQAYLGSGQESRASQDAYNQAQNQRFTQGAAQGQFANAAQQQAYQQAAERAGFGNTAATQQYQMGQDYSSFLNNLRQGQMQERTSLRNQPINEISALMSGSQVTVPQFQPFSQQGINAAPIGQYIGQNYANQANAAAQQNQGLFGLGSSLLGGMFKASDRRLKEDIEPLGGQLAGVPLYRFRFKGQPQPSAGVMADEARQLHPDAVIEIDGFDVVDYRLLVARHTGGLSHGF
ncbi:tail fiber domain-containing protein [Mesorhizobium sp. M1409]|uniref:tail fiber domain-containing protein n=1 Tax=Mesorhizobium sp. M1409 TaxID=2957100 RepID=UPI003338A213